jgi:DinB superfamily
VTRDNKTVAQEHATQNAIEEYIARIGAYVKGKDPLAVLKKTPSTLAQLVERAPEGMLRQRPAPSKWSVVAILAHLAEVESASTWRYRQMIENNGGPLSAFNQDEWARLGDYESWSAQEALELFRLLREANLRMFARLTAEEWQRFGMHVERGRLTVRDLMTQMAGHDLNHVEQIEHILGTKLG